MNVNTNNWNKIRYTLVTPMYNLIVGVLNESRRKSIQNIDFKPNDKVLIVGAGTGLDLEFIPEDCEIVATDITPSMVQKINKLNKRLGKQVSAQQMDGQKLSFENESFNVLILHLILAVIPDPVACIKEAERVLKPGGQIAVFDKFVKTNSIVSAKRKILNVMTNFFFTDITRHFEQIVGHTKLQTVSDKYANFNGNFRLIKLTKV